MRPQSGNLNGHWSSIRTLSTCTTNWGEALFTQARREEIELQPNRSSWQS